MTEPQHMSHWPSWPLPVVHEVTVTDTHPCNYLPAHSASFRAFQTTRLSPAAYQAYMDAGFRRSGRLIYQPACPGCRKCLPLRVPSEKFTPSKSQRRVLRKNRDLQVRLARPIPTPEKWQLYDRYQKDWHDGQQANDAAGFVKFLYQSPAFTLEFEYRDAPGRLLGVGLCDLSPKSLSSVYFYFDPAHRRRSLGTFSALYEILWARDASIPYWYGGYWITGCHTMEYKARFRPCEILCTDGQWRPLPPENLPP